MNNLNLKALLIFCLFLIVNFSYGQIFKGYLITTDKDSIVSEFKIDSYNKKIIDMGEDRDYNFYNVKLLYAEYNDIYYRTFLNPETNKYELFKVLEEGKYSYYEGDKYVLLIKDSLLVFFPLSYGYNQSNYVQFLGKLNFVFDQQLEDKDFNRIIDDKGYIKYGRFLEFAKRFNGENHNPRFRTKSKIKPQFYIGAGYSGQFWAKVQFPGYPRLPKPINSTGFMGYSVIGKIVLRRIMIGFGFSSINATIKEGRYNKKVAVNGVTYYMNVVDDIDYKFNRLFSNVGYRFDLGRIGLQPFAQLNYATINTVDTVKVNTQIQQTFTDGVPLFTPDLYKFSNLVLSAGVNFSFELTSNSLLDFEIITDLNSVTTKGDSDEDIMAFRNILGLNIRYVYKFK